MEYLCKRGNNLLSKIAYLSLSKDLRSVECDVFTLPCLRLCRIYIRAASEADQTQYLFYVQFSSSFFYFFPLGTVHYRVMVKPFSRICHRTKDASPGDVSESHCTSLPSPDFPRILVCAAKTVAGIFQSTRQPQATIIS